MKKVYLLTRYTEILGVFETKTLANTALRGFKLGFEVNGLVDNSLYVITELIVNKIY